jgi:hypothetical protein
VRQIVAGNPQGDVDVTSTEARQSWSDRLNPRNWTLTVKLVVVGIVPALLALVLGVLRVSDQAGAAAELGQSTELVEVQERVAGTADALRQERDEATLFVAGGRQGDRGVLEIGFNQSEAEAEEMLAALEGADGLEPTSLSAVAESKGQIGQLQNLRADVTDNPSIGSRQILDRYSEVITSLDVLDRALLREVRTPGTAGLADALNAVKAAGEQLAVQHTILGAACRPPTPPRSAPTPSSRGRSATTRPRSRPSSSSASATSSTTPPTPTASGSRRPSSPPRRTSRSPFRRTSGTPPTTAPAPPSNAPATCCATSWWRRASRRRRRPATSPASTPWS